MSNGIFPIARAANGDNDPLRASTGAAKFGTASVTIKATPGRLYRLEVVNDSATPLFLLVFDFGSAVSNGSQPRWRRVLPANGEAVLTWDQFGLACLSGITIAVSTTVLTQTFPATSDCTFQAHYK